MRSVLPAVCVGLFSALSACESTKTSSSKDDCEYARLLQGLQQASGRSGQATTDKDGNPAVAFGSITYENMRRFGVLPAADGGGAAPPLQYENVLLSKKQGEGYCAAALAYQTVAGKAR